ncbi:MAG: hypothetical protein COA78_33035, partial [Blastopirellula sp.]
IAQQRRIRRRQNSPESVAECCWNGWQNNPEYAKKEETNGEDVVSYITGAKTQPEFADAE